ncbi:type II secretion system protein [Sulfurovum sp. bin170]|uniref:type II secretion system protein n=1 Tax=Sulfurovum sp. bin170 TaxID=2695268 RepID=UPI0013DF72C4|nr:type II secretion system protein [Sulfurovum sp. bin170]NEW60100.1 type II secretion system protein [Sulfurovum sp. bin170]
MRKSKKAFSLIEVVFVLVILGIVASISSQIIVQVYENYITQKALYNTTTKTELVANQIVNRLSYVIDGTTIAKNPNSSFAYTADSENTDLNPNGNWTKLEKIPLNDNNFTTIEWIGYDNDSFSAGATPYWSGIANYETASRNSFETPGSDLTSASEIINNLSNNDVDLTDTKELPAIIFIENSKQYQTDLDYSPACMGLVDEDNTSCIFRVSMIDNTNFSFPDGLPKIVTERYKLAWSAYALVPEDPDGDSNGDGVDDDGLYDLVLYSNYQPWNNENYEDDGSKSLLIRNVSVFKFTENGGVIQLKLCATENIGQNFNISSCKEKAIIR